MAREAHLSVRLSREEKEALDRAASALDLTVGQVVRRAIRAIVSAAAPGEKAPVVRKRTNKAVERSREMRWLEEHAAEMASMAGEWLVIEGDALVAHGPDYSTVLAQARDLGIEVPFVEWVPEERPMGFCMGL